MRSSSNASQPASESSRSSLTAKSQKTSLSKKRNRRKTVRAKKGGDVFEERKLVRHPATESVLVSRTVQDIDHVHHFDRELVERTHKQAAKVKPKSVKIHFEAHEPSAHVIRLQGMARKISSQTREPRAHTIQAWVAPCEAPPSLERMAAEALDLYIDELDPQDLYTQFTPFDPEAAYRERRGWWERLRAPFVRWELSWHPIAVESEAGPEISGFESTSVMAEQPQVVVPPRALAEESQEIIFPAPTDFEEQFTTGTEPVPMQRFWSSWRHRLGDWFEGVTDQVRTKEEIMVEDAEQVLGVPVLVPRLHLVRVFAGFAALLLLVSVPAGAVSLSRSFSSTVTKTLTVSQGAAQEAKGVWSHGSIQPDALRKASSAFSAANAELAHSNGFAAAIVQALPKTRDLYRAGRLLLDAGEKGTRAAEILQEGINRALGQSVTHPDERLQAIQTHLEAAAPLLAEANEAVSRVDPGVLPPSTREQITTLRDSLQQGEAMLHEARLLTSLGISALGHDRPRTYLFIFQNQTELRPTGGFMGSIAEVVMDRGEIRSMRVPGGGPYDLRNQLLARVRPPEPLQLVSSRWEFQDANWFPDFPTAAKKINWFWSQSGQPTLDGIVTVNAKVLQDLLRITGPISLAEYGKTFDADNVLLELQKSVELEYDKTENKPKKIIGDLLPKVLERLQGTDQEHLLTLLQTLGKSLQTKDIQLWLQDEQEQGVITDLGWSGVFPEVVGDTLALNEANIGGQKTDAVIGERVEHDIDIQTDGSVVDTVTFYRQHSGEKGELFHGANNVAYIRLYAPVGSELVSASGFQPPPHTAYKTVLPEDPQDADVAAIETHQFIDPSGVQVSEEFGRTAFGGWVQLGPGASSKTVFRYKLPINVFDLSERLKGQAPSSDDSPSVNQSLPRRAAYLMSLISQSGKSDRALTLRIHTPPGWRVAWSNQSPVAEEEQDHVVTLANWDHDQVIAFLFDLPHDEARP